MAKVGKEGENAPQIEFQQLPERELEDSAFKLIKDFRTSFRNARDFQDAAAQTYIGELDHGYVVTPSHARRVEFLRKNGEKTVFWRVVYDFTEDSHTLNIERATLNSENISLKSRRLEHQEPKNPARISYLRFDYADNKNAPWTSEPNNADALKKAQELLADFNSSH